MADGIVLTHGAGGHAGMPLLVALAAALAARGLVVERYDLPFRQARRKGPPRPPRTPSATARGCGGPPRPCEAG